MDEDEAPTGVLLVCLSLAVVCAACGILIICDKCPAPFAAQPNRDNNYMLEAILDNEEEDVYAVGEGWAPQDLTVAAMDEWQQHTADRMRKQTQV